MEGLDAALAYPCARPHRSREEKLHLVPISAAKVAGVWKRCCALSSGFHLDVSSGRVMPLFCFAGVELGLKHLFNHPGRVVCPE